MKKTITVSIVLISIFCSFGIACAAINNITKGLPAVALLLLKPDNQTLSGQFLDSKVIGLPYRTETMSGITNYDGTFKYKRGEHVEFYIGVTTLGSILAKPIVTPRDLSDFSDEILYNKSARIALTLQSLDSDLNPDNGISLSSQALNSFSSVPLNFDVERDSDFINNLQAFSSGNTRLAAPMSLSGGDTFDLSLALQHLQSTLDNLDEDCPYFSDLVPNPKGTQPYYDTTCADKLRLYAWDSHIKGNSQFYINLIDNAINNTTNHHDNFQNNENIEKLIIGVTLLNAATKSRGEFAKAAFKEGVIYFGGQKEEEIAEFVGALVTLGDFMVNTAACVMGSGWNLVACKDAIVTASIPIIKAVDTKIANHFLNNYEKQKNELKLTSYIIEEMFKHGHNVLEFNQKYNTADHSLDTMITNLGEKLCTLDSSFSMDFDIEEVKTLLNTQLRLATTVMGRITNDSPSQLLVTQNTINNNTVTVNWEWEGHTFIYDGPNSTSTSSLTLRCTSADSQYTGINHYDKDLTAQKSGTITLFYSGTGVKKVSCEVTDVYKGIYAKQTIDIDIGDPDYFNPKIEVDTLEENTQVNWGDKIIINVKGSDNRNGLRLKVWATDYKRQVFSEEWYFSGNSFAKTVEIDTSDWSAPGDPYNRFPVCTLDISVIDAAGNRNITGRQFDLIATSDQSKPSASVTEGIVTNGTYPVGHQFSLLIEASDDSNLQNFAFKAADSTGSTIVSKTWTVDTKSAIEMYSFSTQGWPAGLSKYWLEATDGAGKTFRSPDYNFTLFASTTAQTDPTALITGIVNGQAYNAGHTFNLTLKGTAPRGLYKINFHVKPPNGTTIENPWFETGTSVEKQHSFSTVGWETGTAYYTLFVKDIDGFVVQDHGSFKVQNNNTTLGTVVSATGRTWMDRNLGASQVATSSTDSLAYGDLYQWGRLADGHQTRTSATSTTLSVSDRPGHGSFIIAPDTPYDWRTPGNDNLWQGVSGTNNPCPSGFRLPTNAEWEAERVSWSSNDAAGAFASPLKLVVAGYRPSGTGVYQNNNFGYYWSSSVGGLLSSRFLYFHSTNAVTGDARNANGMSVRCIEDDTLPPAGTVISAGGQVWMDRNLGASQVATSSTDTLAYGDLYQWGRGTDGHEKRTSGTTTTIANDTNNPGHGNFILSSSTYDYDWRSPQNDNLWQGVSGTNNPCPAGFRLPTDAEWDFERLSWSSNNAAGAFASPLKLVAAGYRLHSNGTLLYVGSYGKY